MQVHKHV
jgi:hypothetical protein